MFLAIQKNGEITSHAPSRLNLGFLFLQLKPKIIHKKSMILTSVASGESKCTYQIGVKAY